MRSSRLNENSSEYYEYMNGAFAFHCDNVLSTLRRRGYMDSRGPRQADRERWESPIIRKEYNTFTENPYGHLVGLEIELTDRQVCEPLLPREVKDKDKDTKWDCVHDGSISSGSEFRLRTITNGDKLLNEITTF